MTKNTGGISAALARGASGKAPGETSRRTKPLRTTLDLKPDLWSDAQRWLGNAQIEAQRTVPLAPVLRLLLTLLVEVDEQGQPTPAARELGGRVMAQIRAGAL